MRKAITFFAIFASIVLFSCNQSNHRRRANSKPLSENRTLNSPTSPATKEERTNTKIDGVKIFFENSASMAGYVNGGDGQNSFKQTYSELVVEASHKLSQNVRIYLSNSSSNEQIEDAAVKSAVEKLLSKLTSQNFKGSYSRIENLIETVIDSAGNNSLSVLVTDGILYVDKTTKDDLDDVSIVIKDKIYTHLKELPKSENFGIRIYQSFSNFEGTYYTRTDSPITLSNTKRPYYTICVGNTSVLDSLRKIENIIFKNGIKQVFEFNSIDYGEQFINNPGKFYWTVLKATNKIGSFKNIEQTKPFRYTGIKSVKPSRGSDTIKLQFSTLFDFSNLPLEKDYLLDMSNYEIQPSTYKISRIEYINELEDLNQDRSIAKDNHGKLIGNYLITVKSKQNTFEDVHIRLKKNLPPNVAAINGSDYQDNDPEGFNTKTWAFKYIIDGIQDGFNDYNTNPDSKNYFDVRIQVDNAENKPLQKVIGFLVLLGLAFVIVLIYLKNKRK